MASPHPIKFAWLSPCIGNQWSNHEPIVVNQVERVLPTAAEHFDAIWVADHFYGFDAKTDPFVEAWTTLTWIGAKIDNVELCHHVLGHGYRPPALTAKMAATLQVFCKNRFVLGIGAGWRQDEYHAYGYDFPRPKIRFEQLEELLQICRLMWTTDEPSFAGTHYSIDGAAAPPLPDVVPPVCIGAAGEKFGLPVVGRQADIWNTFVRSDDDWKHKRAIVDHAAAEAGREPTAIQSCTTIEKPLPESDSDSAELLELLGSRLELGITYFVMDFGNPENLEPIARFAEQVIAPLRAG